MKKFIASILTICITLALALSLTGCGGKAIKIAVPNDTTNEARALRLLEAQGIIKLKNADNETITPRDIVGNPYNVKIVELEAAQIPALLQDVDYAIINSNYAIAAGLTPFVTEGTNVSYPNAICVKAGNEDEPLTKALVAAINSKQVKDYIEKTYKGAIVCDLGVVTNGYDTSVDYEALAGKTLSIAASPTPHADILKIAAQVLAEKNITLKIIEHTDYVQPNLVVESGEVYANYFQHIPYLDSFNAENKTHIVSVLLVHHEPMGVYSAKNNSWEGLNK